MLFPAINRAKCSRIVLTALATENVDQTRPHHRRSRALRCCAENRLPGVRGDADSSRPRCGRSVRPGSPSPGSDPIEMLAMQKEGGDGHRAVAGLMSALGGKRSYWQGRNSGAVEPLCCMKLPRPMPPKAARLVLSVASLTRDKRGQESGSV
jgi:hypothetical protein